MSKHEKPRRPRTTHSWSDGPPSWRQGLISIAVIFAAVFVLFREIVLKEMAFSSQTDTIASISYEHAGRTLQEKEGGGCPLDAVLLQRDADVREYGVSPP